MTTEQQTTAVTTPSEREIRVERVFHTAEERDGMLQSGMERGLSEADERFDALLVARR